MTVIAINGDMIRRDRFEMGLIDERACSVLSATCQIEGNWSTALNESSHEADQYFYIIINEQKQNEIRI